MNYLLYTSYIIENASKNMTAQQEKELYLFLAILLMICVILYYVLSRIDKKKKKDDMIDNIIERGKE